MTLGIDHSLPRFLIDDTADISNARVFVVHTQEPRFIGELLPGDETEIDGVTLSGLSHGQAVCRVLWIDDPVFDADELCRAMVAAIDIHQSTRGMQ